MRELISGVLPSPYLVVLIALPVAAYFLAREGFDRAARVLKLAAFGVRDLRIGWREVRDAWRELGDEIARFRDELRPRKRRRRTGRRGPRT